MTTQTATAPSTPIRSRRRGLLTSPAAAGIGFVVAWVTGLALWPSNLDVAATGAKVVSTYTGHQGVAVTQYLLVEGLAAIALAVVVIALGRAARRRGAGRLGSVVALARRGLLPRWLGYVAAALATAMVASGAGYLLLSNTLAQAAAVSLGLLVIWVLGTGVALGRSSG